MNLRKRVVGLQPFDVLFDSYMLDLILWGNQLKLAHCFRRGTAMPCPGAARCVPTSCQSYLWSPLDSRKIIFQFGRGQHLTAII